MEPRVHVLGNAGVDIILRVTHAVADGETLIAHGSSRAPGGKGLNQAVVAARAGAGVRFFAPLGDDQDAAMVRTALARECLSEFAFRRCGLPTDLSVVIVEDGGGNRIVSTSLCADSITPDDAMAFTDAVRPGDVFVMQGNLSRAATEAAARAATAHGASIVLNLAPFRWDKGSAMPACHIVVNALEATQATGCDDPLLAAPALCAAGARTAIVTIGAGGCVVAIGGSCRKFPAIPAKAVDTTGAGDTFCGVFAAALARGFDLAKSIAWAQRAAAITVSRPGAFDALPLAQELADLIR